MANPDKFKALEEDLIALGPESLAHFIVQMAEMEERLYQAACSLSQKNNPKELAKTIRQQLSALKAKKRSFHFRDSARISPQLHDILDRIEKDLLPLDSEAALKLLAVFVESDAAFFGHVDDSSGMMGDAFRRAAELLGKASEAAGKPREAGIILRRLLEKNDYGVRDAVYDQARALLPESQLRQLIDEWRKALAARPGNDDHDFERYSLKIRLEQIAKSLGDPDLYVEIKLDGKPTTDIPAFALDIAKLYLAAEQPEKALAHLPQSSSGHWQNEIQRMKIAIYEALGDRDTANAIRLDLFRNDPCTAGERDYLECLAEAERPVAAAELRRMVDDGPYPWYTKARYYIDANDLAAAAEAIETHAAQVLQYESYYHTDFAKALAAKHPRAATILLRGATDQTVQKANSKYYPRAVRSIKKLVLLSDQIDDWGTLETHEDWWRSFSEKHRRKSALARKLLANGIRME